MAAGWDGVAPTSAQAAIAPVATSTATNTATSTLMIKRPSGVAAGQVLLATVTANGTGAITAPSGWTQVQNTVTGQRQITYFHVAASGDPLSWSWALSSTRAASGGIIAYSGVNTASPIDASAANSGSSGNAVAPSVTTHASGDRVVAAVSFAPAAANSVTPDASTTERYDTAGLLGTGLIGTESEVADFTQATAGSTATKTATPLSSAAWIAHTIALNDTANAGLSVATSASPSFSASLPNGDQTSTYTLPLTAQDTRTGTGAGTGWNLQITSTPFTSGSHTLPTSASHVTGVTSACADGAVCVAPTNSVTYPVAVPAGTGPPAAAKMFNAASATGTGPFTIIPTISVDIPANAYAGSYTSTVTVTIASGP